MTVPDKSTDLDAPLTEHWVQLDASAAGEIALVLDASESANEHGAEITSLAAALLEQLPRGGSRPLFFLGNPKRYDAHDLARNAPTWFGENSGRLSILAPILEKTRMAPGTRVVIIGDGAIHDLEDWLSPDLLLVHITNPLAPPGVEADECGGQDVAEIVRRLTNPIENVQITGRGCVPLVWDNPGYTLHHDEAGQWRLEARGLDGFTIQARFHGPARSVIKAIQTLADGRERAITLDGAAPVAIAAPQLARLDEQDAALFTMALERGVYPCPFCKEDHLAKEWSCRRGDGKRGLLSLMGRPVLRSIPRAIHGWVILREENGAWMVSPCAAGAIVLDASRVAILKEGRAEVYAYTPERETWETEQHALALPHPQGGGAYVVYL